MTVLVSIFALVLGFSLPSAHGNSTVFDVSEQVSINVENNLADILADVGNLSLSDARVCERARGYISNIFMDLQRLRQRLDPNYSERSQMVQKFGETYTTLILRLNAAINWHIHYLRDACNLPRREEFRKQALAAFVAAYQVRRILTPHSPDLAVNIVALLGVSALTEIEANLIRVAGDTETTLAEILRYGGQATFPISRLPERDR